MSTSNKISQVIKVFGDLTKERDGASAKAQKSGGSKTNEMISEENIPRILSTAFVERSASQVTGLAVIGSNAGLSDVKATHPQNGPAWALRYFVVDMVEAPSKFRRECYETVKIQREVEKHFEVSVTLNQSAIKGRSGSIEAVNESTCNIVKEYLDPSKPIGNL
ncbi:hypothetical protein BY996DRAFT_6487211 [Phakopsora pachyrhizi]|nr:hypothetical protein BY996DRAFT_6487211 [Phakopsora pachyrhizi]